MMKRIRHSLTTLHEIILLAIQSVASSEGLSLRTLLGSWLPDKDLVFSTIDFARCNIGGYVKDLFVSLDLVYTECGVL
jgi:hypothetical protein